MAEKKSTELSSVREEAVQELESHGATHPIDQLEVFQTFATGTIKLIRCL